MQSEPTSPVLVRERNIEDPASQLRLKKNLAGYIRDRLVEIDEEHVDSAPDDDDSHSMVLESFEVTPEVGKDQDHVDSASEEEYSDGVYEDCDLDSLMEEARAEVELLTREEEEFIRELREFRRGYAEDEELN